MVGLLVLVGVEVTVAVGVEVAVRVGVKVRVEVQGVPPTMQGVLEAVKVAVGAEEEFWGEEGLLLEGQPMIKMAPVKNRAMATKTR